MFLKKLELIGFKSFSDKTILNFEPGITAVVGPNGCGKSNIFDSMRWVLGEQSAKSLRGSEMQDVIFNGTDSKEPVGMAEVSLTFDNKQKFFAFDNDELVITRRLFRSGESEYLLNKVAVRLKDILDLLSGTGIGAEGYSLVEQGRIDLILSSKPEDRRMVFDEAAGIIKYKSQKKEAMRRLEETDLNLSRVNDIITEVKRQIGSLERQVNKARKYKEVFEELKLKEINLAIILKKGLMLQKDGLIKQLSELEAGEIQLLSLIESQESSATNCQSEIKSQEANIMSIKETISNLDNQALRNKQHIKLNQERIIELEANKGYLGAQIQQAKNRIVQDEEELKKAREDSASVKKNIAEKTALLKIKEEELSQITLSIKNSLTAIAEAKKAVLEIVTDLTSLKNRVTDLSFKQQALLARKKRLELEKAKVREEKAVIEGNLNEIVRQLSKLQEAFDSFALKISGFKKESEDEKAVLSDINKKLLDTQNQKIALQSQKEFVEKLQTQYDGINESLNAMVYLDKLPAEDVSALVIKIKDHFQVKRESLPDGLLNFKISGEAKPIDLDVVKINNRIIRLEEEASALKNNQIAKEKRISDLNQTIEGLEQDLRNQEISLANKKTVQEATIGQFNKIKEEEDIIILELTDTDKELQSLESELSQSQAQLTLAEDKQRENENSIANEQNNITFCNDGKEKLLVVITQAKTESDVMVSRINSEAAILKNLEDALGQDKEALLSLETQVGATQDKRQYLEKEINDLENQIIDHQKQLDTQKILFAEAQVRYTDFSKQANDIVQKIELDRRELDNLKNKLYELQMQNKDIDFKITSIQDRIQQAYKMELDIQIEAPQELDIDALSDEIQKLKEKLDSYGTVNLVAIEEYEELKKRYDFLVQQQNDLISAKDALHEAILKINRTTKQMFLETFAKIQEEFRNYFKLLFGGGDARIFLIDEHDPLESGIEIICRPPGKKLQNVLLLSGGEKSLSAIALIFAIFKVKPSPFCILDEIDAALDEANVDRFSRKLQEFATGSQFIIITHNKKTIANADVMYGITMEESGISKIVSVKFGQKEAIKEGRQEVVEPV